MSLGSLIGGYLIELGMEYTNVYLLFVSIVFPDFSLTPSHCNNI